MGNKDREGTTTEKEKEKRKEKKRKESDKEGTTRHSCVICYNKNVAPFIYSSLSTFSTASVRAYSWKEKRKT